MTSTLAPQLETTEAIHAAGGIIVRSEPGEAPKVAVVWRELRGDWTFPKGKLDVGETYEQAACREVVEETGMTCRVARFIGTTEYLHRKGRPKVVAYFLMAEVRRRVHRRTTRWTSCAGASVREAERLLTWDRDRDLLARAAQLPELRS